MLLNEAGKLRIFLADDHPLTLAGVKDLLSRDPNIDVEKSVSTSSELVEALRANSADIVITDYSMPGDKVYGDGIRFIEYLIRNFPSTKFLVLTMQSNPMIVSELYVAGVWGVIQKADKLNELTSAISNIRLGNKYYSKDYLLQQKGRKSKSNKTSETIDEKISSLSPREFEVLRLFVRGEGVVKIADNLNRSVKTVSTQKRSAMLKLNVNTDQDLIASCIKFNIFN